MRLNKSPSLRGSVTQNNVSVRMRAKDGPSLGLRLSLLAGAFLILSLVAFMLWRSGWIKQETNHLLDSTLAITQNLQFSVKDITVSGRHRANRSDVFDALATERGQPILGFDPTIAAARLVKVPWVESAVVERHLPSTITVTLTERAPLARWQHDDQIYVIDTSGRPLPTAQPNEFATLPLVVGAGANTETQALLGYLKNYPLIQDKVESAVRVGERRWDLHLRPKTTIRLPEDDVPAGLRRLSTLITQDQILDRDLVTIDLRIPDRLILEPSTPVKPAGAPRS